MFFKLQPLMYSCFFLLSLEVVVFKEDWVQTIAWILIFLTIIIVWPLTRKPRFIALPLFLSLGSLGLLYLVDHRIEKQAFVFLATIIYYLTLLGGYRLRFYNSDQTALGMINLATMSTAFLWFSASLGFFLNFEIEKWVMLSFILTIFLISLPSLCTNAIDRASRLKKINKNCSETNLISVIFLNLILALVMSQVFWGIIFLPFGYLTLGGSALIIFYGFWSVIRLYIRNELSFKRVWFDFFTGIILLVIILSTAQWDLVARF